ncbi:hypothetical protein R1flu_022613 [Riccia fluitans]|uniref:Zinc transporter n=1 Tax=Riccia fluitans TaxID=41844 RepID=A0ABD1XSL0_9MARC
MSITVMNRMDFFCLITAVLLLSSFLIGPVSAHGGVDDGHDEEKTVDLRAKSLILVKVYCLIIVFFATFIPGVSPYFFRWSYGFLALGIQFAGGVFLATAMLHFLSDANETFKDLTPKSYPFAFMLACSGYLLTAIADVIIVTVLNRHAKNNRTMDLENGKDATNQAPVSKEQEETQHSHHFVKVSVIPSAPLGDALLLILALCFHSVFDGIAIGVAATAHDARRSLWTISLLKVFAAIAMGIALLRILPNRPLLSCASYAFAFAISSPIGVAIGIVIDSTSQGRTADWIYAISMGVGGCIRGNDMGLMRLITVTRFNLRRILFRNALKYSTSTDYPTEVGPLSVCIQGQLTSRIVLEVFAWIYPSNRVAPLAPPTVMKSLAGDPAENS